ncbi:unnamed protein product [Echinostoma caproni]|uniref:C2 domain-containing protein n=1 Tax=Echinostoma caproni TaxID=27848 RepID=A0A183AZL9_9TREM|nr:unnamed protein product [Echinostoma caproni]
MVTCPGVPTGSKQSTYLCRNALYRNPSATLINNPETSNALRNVDETVSRRHGQLDLFGSDTGPNSCIGMIVGKLDYWIRLTVPMPQALRIYRERFRSLPRMPAVTGQARLQPPQQSGPDGEARGDGAIAPDGDPGNNQLCVYITSASDLRARRPDCLPSPYFVYQFYDQPEQVSVVMEACSNAKFDHLQSYPVVMDEKLDQYLRTHQLTVFLMDNADPEEAASCLGAAQIPLLGLVTRGPQGRIEGTFAVQPLTSVEAKSPPNDSSRLNWNSPATAVPTDANGQIHIKLYWQRPYTFGRSTADPIQTSQSGNSVEKNEPEILTASTVQSVQSAPKSAGLRGTHALKSQAKTDAHVVKEQNETAVSELTDKKHLTKKDTIEPSHPSGSDQSKEHKTLKSERKKSPLKSEIKSDDEAASEAGLPDRSNIAERRNTNASSIRLTRKAPTVSVLPERLMSSPDQTSTEGIVCAPNADLGYFFRTLHSIDRFYAVVFTFYVTSTMGTRSNDSNFPKPLPRQKLSKTHSPRSVTRIQSLTGKKNVAESKLVSSTESPRQTPTAKIDDGHVQIRLNRIQLTRKPASWKDWGKTHRVFVEYRFLGYAEPFETGSYALSAKETGGKPVYEAELNYAKSK